MKLKNTEQKYIKNNFDNLPSSIENEDEYIVDIQSEVEKRFGEALNDETRCQPTEPHPTLPDYDEYSPFTKSEHDRLQKMIDMNEEFSSEGSSIQGTTQSTVVSNIERLQEEYARELKRRNPYKAIKLKECFEEQIAMMNRERMNMTPTFRNHNPDIMSYDMKAYM